MSRLKKGPNFVVNKISINGNDQQMRTLDPNTMASTSLDTPNDPKKYLNTSESAVSLKEGQNI